MLRILLVVFGVVLGASSAMAGDVAWTLVPSESTIAYESIRKDTAGEVNMLTTLGGGVGRDGEVEVQVNVASIRPMIDFGNDKLVAYAFDIAKPTAVLTTEVDLARLEELVPGQSTEIPAQGHLLLSGIPIAVKTKLRIARQSATRVLVTTKDKAKVDTDSLGAMTGLSGLVEVAGLSGISRTTTVSMHLIFEKANAL